VGNPYIDPKNSDGTEHDKRTRYKDVKIEKNLLKIRNEIKFTNMPEIIPEIFNPTVTCSIVAPISNAVFKIHKKRGLIFAIYPAKGKEFVWCHMKAALSRRAASCSPSSVYIALLTLRIKNRTIREISASFVSKRLSNLSSINYVPF
jgi:hypothetical protein